MEKRNAEARPRVVIVGAGFGGLEAARALRRVPVEVVLVDQNNYHTFQPLLYQVATAALEPEEIAHAVRGVFQRQANVDFRMATVTGVDFEARQVLTEAGIPISYDYLILAAGASTNDFGVPGVEANAFPLKSLSDAINLRSHVIRQFEQAALNPPCVEEGALNFVVVGGGPTGVEMAGALVELFDMVLKKDFRAMDVAQAKVYLIEMTGHVLSPFAEKLRRYAARVLKRRGVELLLETSVVEVTEEGVRLKSGEFIPTQTLIWAAGVRASRLADALSVEQGRGGRILVEPDLRITGREREFVVGDLAASRDEAGNLYPQLAPVAMQGARHAARQIEHLLKGEETEPFIYRDKGIMATIGRNAAVAEIEPGIKARGFAAWLVWLFLHLMMLVGFRNRVVVFVNWAWNYFTYDRSARMIIDALPEAGFSERLPPRWRDQLGRILRSAGEDDRNLRLEALREEDG